MQFAKEKKKKNALYVGKVVATDIRTQDCYRVGRAWYH